MSPVLHFDIIALIIDIVGENKDTNLLKELALVSHLFLQLCSKYLFATVELHDAVPKRHIASSKKGFVKLLKSRPEVVKYIRKLTYKMENNTPYHSPQISPTYSSLVNDDHLLLPILPNFLRTISYLSCLTITASKLDWNALDPSLTSALLHLMHLPTINHIDLSYIQNFPLSSLTPSVNLLRLDLSCVHPLLEGGSHDFVVQSEMMPKIREFHISESSLLMTTLLHAKRQDGQPAFNFVDLKRLSLSSIRSESAWNVRYLLQNAKILEHLHLTYFGRFQSPEGLHDILSYSARTLKVLDLTISEYFYYLVLLGLCEEFEAMAGHNVLESLSLEVRIGGRESDEFIGLVLQRVGDVLVEPGWSALRQISFKVSIACCAVSREANARLTDALQSLPDKYLKQLSKLESVTLNYSAYCDKCVEHE